MNRTELIKEIMNYVDSSHIGEKDYDLEFVKKILVSGLIPSVEWSDYQLIKIYLYENKKDLAYNLCKKYENSSNKILLGLLSSFYKSGIGTTPCKEKYEQAIIRCVESGGVWKIPEYVDILLQNKTSENLMKVIQLSEAHSTNYPVLYLKAAIARYYLYGATEDTLSSIKVAIEHNIPGSRELLVEYANNSTIDSEYVLNICGITTRTDLPEITVNLKDNSLTIRLISKKKTDAKYSIYKNYALIKTGEISSDSTLNYLLTDQGLYSISCKLPTGETINSPCIEYFSNSLKQEYLNKIENYAESNSPRISFIKSNKPFFDFIYTNEKLDSDFFTKFNSTTVPEGIIYTTIDCANEQIISSGIGIHENTFIKSSGHQTFSKEDIGCFSCIDYADGVTIYTDYFGKGKIYYYLHKNTILVSNRYHLLIIAISTINPLFKIDEEVCLSQYNSYVDVLTLQSVNSKQLVTNSYLLPIGEYIEIKNNLFNIKSTSYKTNFESIPINKEEYELQLDAAINELIQNLETVLNSKYYNTCLIDVTGGIDSRIILGILNRCKCDGIHIIPLTKAFNEKDLTIGSMLIDKLKYTYNRSISCLFNKILTTEKFKKITKSEYLEAITSLTLDSFDPNALVHFFKIPNVLHIGGYDGESFTRPHMSLGSRNWIMSNESVDEIAHQYVNSTLVNGITTFDKTSIFLEKLLKDSISKFAGSSTSKFEQIYPNFPARFHFDPFIHNSISTDTWIPFMSKKLFNLWWRVLDQKPFYSFVFDLTMRINKDLYPIPYAGTSDDLMRILSKQYMLNNQVILKECNKSIDKFAALNESCVVEVNGSLNNLDQYSESFPMEKSYVLNLLLAVCKKSIKFKETIGLQLYYFIMYSSESKGAFKPNSSYYYLYKKLALLNVALSLKGENRILPTKSDIKSIFPLDIECTNDKLIIKSD